MSLQSRSEFPIDGRMIGSGHPPYVIAEISANHNGDLGKALQTIDMIADCGADAVKIQTYTADTMTIDCDAQEFQIQRGLWDGYTLYDLYKQAHTPYEWHQPIFDHARKAGITLFSSPFDETAVDLLENLGAPAYKIASFEVVDLPLIRYVAKTGKPMIVSTGMADLTEIHDAVEVALTNGCRDLVLLHCVSSYPAPPDQSNLATIADLSNRFGVVCGLSDHTLGTAVSVAAAAVGASVIEKHVTLDRNDKGPDSDFSLEPHELKRLCNDVDHAFRAIGKASYDRMPSEKENLQFRRSIYVVKDIQKGDCFNAQNIRRIRPGYGLPPKYFDDILGKRARTALKAGTPLGWPDIAD